MDTFDWNKFAQLVTKLEGKKYSFQSRRLKRSSVL